MILMLLIISNISFSQVTNNFENGAWIYYSNHCWGIGPNNSYFGTDITANSLTISGTKVCHTGNLGQYNTCRLESPWINIAAGNITFNHGIPSFDGTRNLKVYLVNESGIATLLWSYTYVNSIPQAGSITVTEEGIFKVRWVWTGSGGNSRGELDNIYIPGVDVSDPSTNCQVYVPPTDTTFINYYPAVDTATLAFEDLWPSYGDYDMNDLIVGYKFKIISNQNHYVSDVYATFTVRAQGADQHNGFGFQLPGISPSNIITVTGVGNQLGYTIASNGTELGNQTDATIIVFSNTQGFMSKWNTVKNEPPCSWVTFNVHLKFKYAKVTLSQLNIYNWNPFLIVNGERGREIHLPGYQPTEMADVALFGRLDDDTQPAANKYYKSKLNLPWALNIYGKFDYPTENADIANVYLHFTDWILSNGTLYQDWWSNTSSTYRQEQFIY